MGPVGDFLECWGLAKLSCKCQSFFGGHLYRISLICLAVLAALRPGKYYPQRLTHELEQWKMPLTGPAMVIHSGKLK